MLDLSKPNEQEKPTNLIILPNVRLHSYPIIRMFPQKRQPQTHRLRMSILDLYQPPQSLPLKILLALLMHEMRPGNSPPLCDSW